MARAVTQTKLLPCDVIEILQSTEDNSTLARKYNVTRQAISLIRNGKSWTDIAPEIPRIPVRITNSVRKDYVKNSPHCHNCFEYKQGQCSYGFPEAIDEPEFAAGCSLYRRNQGNP